MVFETWSLLVALVLCVWALVMEWCHRRSLALGQLPPGPRAWPVVGNLFQLGFGHPLESFARLAQEHGPIMFLRLGSMNTVVVSTAQAAQDMFVNHDMALAGRKIYEAMKGKHGNDGSLITAQYGSHWRMLRRICTLEFFTKSRLDEMCGVRQRCVDHLVRDIEEKGGVVDLGQLLFSMAFNLIGNLMFSRDVLDPGSKKGAEFFYHARSAMEIAAIPNVADFLPLLRWFDPQRIRKKMDYHVERALNIAEGFIEERMERNGSEGGESNGKMDYLTVLLEFEGNGVEEPAKFSSWIINHLIFEMFVAATDTTTSTLEWAMAELLRNPQTLIKVQAELRRVVGLDRKMEEKDAEDLPYLKAVVKETLRLHPPLPFLVPHKAMSPCKMLGYYIPQETQILVNVWAMGRDPKSWEDPLAFKPERFMQLSHIDFKGHHFEFLPFGSGRRMCPAVPLASRLLPLALGSLLHSFDWVLADNLRPEAMDMSKRMGMTLKKAVPLRVLAKPYKGCTTHGST
ncbi:cytochrome P450, family 76, subfamily G, polypeptide 1 [Tasmannia lanceolata]|uniref:cytochrome P450, family 76, subfamily G, polypeptide 1 n=1 Tax=Tasmannia lanceolata TaxID=3420 RepID=UPI0040641177